MGFQLSEGPLIVLWVVILQKTSLTLHFCSYLIQLDVFSVYYSAEVMFLDLFLTLASKVILA